MEIVFPSVRMEPRESFVKLNHFCPAVFLQNSVFPFKRETLIESQKIFCEQKSVKFGGNVGFLCDLVHSFTTNAKQDKIRCLF